MKLTLAPVVGAWPRASLDAFYAAVTEAPVDTVYLGGVPGRRNDDYGLHDWLDTAARLVDAGKQVVLGAQTLLASNADVRTLRRIARDGPYLVEANDMGSVQMLADHAPFVAGPDLDVYHSNMLDFLVSRGATRWVPSPDMSCASFEAILRASGSRLETEVYAWGRLPLDFPPGYFFASLLSLSSCEPLPAVLSGRIVAGVAPVGCAPRARRRTTQWHGSRVGQRPRDARRDAVATRGGDSARSNDPGLRQPDERTPRRGRPSRACDASSGTLTRA